MNGEINVVSLIDVMMLLMVIFMIAAPMMQSGIDIALPQVDATALESKSAVTVTVLKDGHIRVDEVTMTEAEFDNRIKALATRRGKDGVTLQADGGTSYERVARVLSSLQKSGITNVGMQTVPVNDRE